MGIHTHLTPGLAEHAIGLLCTLIAHDDAESILLECQSQCHNSPSAAWSARSVPLRTSLALRFRIPFSLFLNGCLI